VKCQTNLKQLALAAHHDHVTNVRFPTGLIAADHAIKKYAGASTMWVELFPFVEQSILKGCWDYTDYRKNIGSTPAPAAIPLAVMICPSDELPGPVHRLDSPSPYDWSKGDYARSGNGGTLAFNWADPVSKDGVFFSRSGVRLTDVTDGSSNTFLLGERSHHDPEFDAATKVYDDLAYPLDSWGCGPPRSPRPPPRPMSSSAPRARSTTGCRPVQRTRTGPGRRIG
jgi:hypothetical protein